MRSLSANRIALNPGAYLASVVWEHSRGHRGRLSLYLVLSGLAVVVYAAEPLPIAALVNRLQNASPLASAVDDALGYVALLAGLQLSFWVLQAWSNILGRQLAYSVRSAYQEQIFRMAVGLPLAWHQNNHSGETVDRVQRASDALNYFLDSGFEIIHLSARFLASVAILCVFMPAAGLPVAIVSALVIPATMLFSCKLFEQDQTLNGMFRRTAAAVHDFLSNFSTVVSLRLPERATAEVRRRLHVCWPLLRANILLNEVKWLVTSLSMTLVIGVVLAFYIYDVLRPAETFQAGTFLALLEYLRRVGQGFGAFAAKYEQLVTQASAVRTAEELVLAFRTHVPSDAAAAQLPAHWRRLTIRNLRFSHSGDSQGGPLTLQDLELTLERGQAIALVGASGSGKSTLLSLFRMLRVPQAVTVECDGRDLPHGLAHVANTTTLVPQEAEIFADSIRFNVSMGVESDDAQVLEALRLAHFTPVLRRLPNALDTCISEKGVSLSGGERQRLALARGLFFAQGSTIVLFDEPTSSVDSTAEYAICQSLLDRFSECCLVMALHQLHLLPLFDRVYVLENGRIVEEGSYSELVMRGGALATMLRDYELKEIDRGGGNGHVSAVREAADDLEQSALRSNLRRSS